MSTAAGGRVCVDVHAHLPMHRGPWDDAESEPGRHLADLDEMGIDIQVIGPMPAHEYASDEQTASRFVDATNQRIASHCRAAPQRLLGLGTVAMQHAPLAVTQLRYAVRELGLRGFRVGTSVHSRPLADPAHDPVWRCAEALEAVVFIHPAECPGDGRPAQLALGDTVGHPVATAVALSNLIFSGVLDRFPRLKVLAPYGGGLLPTAMGRSDHGWLARPEARGCLRPPSEYLGRLWFDSLVYTPQNLESLVEAVGPGQVVLGTGYPLDLGVTDPIERLDATLLSDSTRDRIRSGNARRLLTTRYAKGLPR